MDLLIEVAVPLPLADPLIYRVVRPLEALATPGSRVRVRVGKRLLVGLILGKAECAPPGVEVRPIEAVLDRAPVLSAELVNLAREIADYYLAPIGEVTRAMVPSGLPPWGDRRVRLSDAGALSAPRDDEEQEVVSILHRVGKIKVADLLETAGGARIAATIERMEREGRVVVETSERRGARYISAVELGSDDFESLLELSGRSRPGRQVLELLRGLGRPATVAEICDAVGCRAGVVRRLVTLGALRTFTQVAKLDLDRHVVSGEAATELVLRDDQKQALEEISRALGEERYRSFLLAGMTGSGKTVVYLEAGSRVRAAGGGAILLVPEIALVPALAAAARSRFGSQVAIFHSGLSDLERQQEWERIRGSEARVVLGPRSAVFAPVADLRLIVVDEEQDGSYKQDQIPRYNGRDVAILRAHRAKAVAVLVSATPSLETRFNVEVGKMQPLHLVQRVGQGELPSGILVDLRAEPPPRHPGEVQFSGRLLQEMTATLERGEQVILLRNRRGYAPMLLCRACGHDFRCPECGLPQTLHRRDRRLRCHYCGGGSGVPLGCPKCSKEALEAIGSGTERVEEQLRELFPRTSFEVLDRDTSRRGEVAAVLERFARGESQVLIGTQMVSKGHHFPNVALTGVLLADTYLGFPDFRAVEKTYSLLVQLAGRAGRGDQPGKVVIQTLYPEHYAIEAALRHDDARFIREEMRFRRLFHYPPYTRMAQILVRDAQRRRGEETIQRVAEALSSDPLAEGTRISGPAEAPLERLRGKWRFQLLVRHPSTRRMHDLLAALRPHLKGADAVIDVDPYELM